MMGRLAQSILSLGLLLGVGGLLSCGGGSVGTGVSTNRRSFEGRTLAVNTAPIQGARVTLINTGESTFSETDGRFLLFSNFEGPNAELQVRSGELSGSIVVPNIQSGTAGIQLTIVLDQVAEKVSASHISVATHIVGSCDPAFEDRRTIRQVAPLLDGTRCWLRIQVYADGRPLGNVPVLVQRRRCIFGAPWHDETSGETAGADSPETGELMLPLNYFNNDAHCVYRVIAPKQEGLEPVIYEILTLRKQEFDRNHASDQTDIPNPGTSALRVTPAE